MMCPGEQLKMSFALVFFTPFLGEFIALSFLHLRDGAKVFSDIFCYADDKKKDKRGEGGAEGGENPAETKKNLKEKRG